MTFVIDHLAHNGNNGGEIEKWGPAVDALGQLPNVYMKMGASEQWGVDNPGAGGSIKEMSVVVYSGLLLDSLRSIVILRNDMKCWFHVY